MVIKISTKEDYWKFIDNMVGEVYRGLSEPYPRNQFFSNFDYETAEPTIDLYLESVEFSDEETIENVLKFTKNPPSAFELNYVEHEDFGI